MDEATGILLRAMKARLGLVVVTSGDPVVSLHKLYSARNRQKALFEPLTFQRVREGQIWVVKKQALAA